MSNINDIIPLNNIKRENIDFKNQTIDLEMLISLKQIIFNLREENLVFSTQRTMKLFDLNYPYSFNYVLSNLIYFAFFSQKNEESNIYINYLQLIQEEEKKYKNIPNIIEFFGKYISGIKSQEAYYLIEKMTERNLINKNIAKNIKSEYFAHYKTRKENKKQRKYNYQFYQTFFANYKKLSKNDWELHKRLIEEGVNPNELAKIIRNDEVEKLQEISSQNGFNFNQTIKPSLYERCSFINQENVTLIDYAAFFSSVKCFKYLLMNEANVKNTGKYAVAGGNEEIIHLCEQNHSSFTGAYKTAIKFHQNDIFKYIYEKKLEVFPNFIEILRIKCILYHNYEILSFLQDEGSRSNGHIINEAARIGNLLLVKCFQKFNQLPKDILVFSIESGNIELVQYILQQKEIDVNAQNIYLFFKKFVKLISYFKITFGNRLNYLIRHY